MNNEEQLLKVLVMPYISEKATLAEANRQYVFKVIPNATKTAIKKAVELLFSVKVIAVQVCKVKGKVKKFGQREGWRPGWKKAYVTLKEGERIEWQ